MQTHAIEVTKYPERKQAVRENVKEQVYTLLVNTACRTFQGNLRVLYTVKVILNIHC